MSVFALKSSRLVAHDRDLSDAWIGIDGGMIADVGGVEPPLATAALDLGDATIIPGLIDIHIHGREGRDVMDADPESIGIISRSLARHGVTGFLATTVTAAWDRTLDALAVVAQCTRDGVPGARLLGAYSEGLFFNCIHKGAHNEAFFLPPTPQRIDAMAAAADGQLRVVALAPEIDGAMETLRHAVARGITVVFGHTDASYDQIIAALAAGGRGGVHVFNGMRGLHHREPGCAGALLLEPCTVEVIADGAHLHPAILDLINRLKRPQDILLISDCMCAGGLADGDYRLGETDVRVVDGVVRTRSGSLAGSTLTLDAAITRMVAEGHVAFRDAVHMASLSPARFLGIESETGSIAQGKRADLVVLDNNGRVRATVVGGKLAHVDRAWDLAPALTDTVGWCDETRPPAGREDIVSA